MQNIDSTEMQRLRYWQGQMLRSHDFCAQADIDASLRWWHNRTLHNAYGIAAGFELSFTFDPADGRTVDEISVAPGIAYDCFGRALILQTQQNIAVPRQLPDGGTARILSVRFRDGDGCTSRQDGADVCSETREAAGREQPDFIWQDARRFELAHGVPLVRIVYLEVDNDVFRPVRDSAFFAPRARALARPRIGSGVTIAGNTAWRSWIEDDIELGLQVRIDTAAAGFTQTPCYFAWLQGPLWRRDLTSDSISGRAAFLPAPLGVIYDSAIDAFTFGLRPPAFAVEWLGAGRRTNERFSANFFNFARQQGLYVSWLGIQHVPNKEFRCEDNHGHF